MDMRAFWVAGLCVASWSLRAVPPPENRGVYAIWYGDEYDLLGAPYIVGGQVVVQWADVDKGEGRYDFSPIETETRKLKRLGKKTTVQINGNSKPAWLFARVPHHPEKLSAQVQDRQGTLMYWHPVHLGAYTNMLGAFAGFLARSPDRDAVIGIRLNFNAIGTEHFAVPHEAMDPETWIVPPGGTRGQPWSAQSALAYERAVVETFVNRLSPHARILVRNNVRPEVEERFRPQIETGKLGWFHTSSEAEPRSASTEIQYRRFYEDCRSGKTVGYAEPWASAWGDHGGGPDPRWCSPPQWNYWRSLIDLHCGVAFVAVYASDLRVAAEGSYHQKGHQYDEARDRRGYRQEFEAAFRFTSKYAGYHASPEESPGAWVAFRENSTALAENPKVPPKGRRLSVFTGDYDFLMERLPDKTAGEHNVGPENQRQGAWARVLPAGESMRLKADDRFAASLRGGDVLVTYLDPAEDAGNTFGIAAGPTRLTVSFAGRGGWQTASLRLPPGPMRKISGDAHIKITAGPRPLHMHMVEIVRQ